MPFLSDNRFSSCQIFATKIRCLIAQSELVGQPNLHCLKMLKSLTFSFAIIIASWYALRPISDRPFFCTSSVHSSLHYSLNRPSVLLLMENKCALRIGTWFAESLRALLERSVGDSRFGASFVCLLIISPSIHPSIGSLGDSARAWLPLSICAFYCAKVVAKLPRELALVVVDGRTRTHPSDAHNNSLNLTHCTLTTLQSQGDVDKVWFMGRFFTLYRIFIWVKKAALELNHHNSQGRYGTLIIKDYFLPFFLFALKLTNMENDIFAQKITKTVK